MEVSRSLKMRLSFKIPILGSLDFFGSTTGFCAISDVFVGGIDGETGGNEFAAGFEVETPFLVFSLPVAGGSRGVSVGGEERYCKPIISIATVITPKKDNKPNRGAPFIPSVPGLLIFFPRLGDGSQLKVMPP